jgi:hypothetical protein
VAQLANQVHRVSARHAAKLFQAFDETYTVEFFVPDNQLVTGDVGDHTRIDLARLDGAQPPPQPADVCVQIIFHADRVFVTPQLND